MSTPPVIDLITSTHTGPVLEVFADVWCPFAHVGLRAVSSERIARGYEDVPLVVRSWPLELVNGAPMNPAKTADHVHHLREQVTPDLFVGLDTTDFPNTTIPALALTNRAYRSNTAVGEQMAFAVRDAMFEEGRNIADPAEIRRLADRFGVGVPDQADIDSVTADWHEGQRRGVIGSPHFFCGDAHAFCPSLAFSRHPDLGMSISFDRSKLMSFLDECFAMIDAAR
jgi:2-hydroxychromene-2-carboxylate isomerase